MRIRTIKPEFYKSEDINGLSRENRLLFIGLWSYVDDNGVGVDDYRQIAADLFPLDNDPIEVRTYVREGLAILARALLITRYKVSGRRYLYVLTWDEHQRVDRPNKPRHPRPTDAATSENGEIELGHPDDSRDPREIPPSGTEEQRNRGTEEKNKDEQTSSACQKSAISDEARLDVAELCDRLHDRIIDNGAKATVTAAWRTAARLLLDRDGRDRDQALKLIDWATADDFWSANILSMPTFRKQYDKLLMKARRESRQPGGVNYQHPTDAAVARLLGQPSPLRALPGGDAT